MAYYRSPVMVVQTYESQGPDSATEASPDELKAFYEDVERRDILERKLSKRKSNSTTSIWSRKSLKRAPTAPPVHPNSGGFPQTPSPSNRSAGQGQITTDAAEKVEERREKNSSAPQLSTSRSAFLDTKEAWASVPLPAFRVNYPLHNPLGPRWYRNYHLIPPSQIKPSMRPPTFFSPSFPPICSSSPMPDPNDESSGPSRTPSHSPLPTPTSSQTRVVDSMKPRSRKTSQTTPDTVDLLDVTDPWGTNWHHTSPYDCFGQTTVSADHQDTPARPRRASMTTTSQHKSVAPSPLSQSTSAVHLHGAQPEIHIPRKLSKRKTPALGSLFGVTPQEDRKVTSAPATPIDRIYLSDPVEIGDENSTSLPRRMSVAPAPSYPTVPQPQPPATSKKEKRGSVLNRLARKFSVLRKSVDQTGHQPPYSVGKVDSWQHANTLSRPELNHDFSQDVDSAFHKQQNSDLTNRAPSPAPVQPEVTSSTAPNDQRSIASLEEPYSMGRLTVANPDVSDSESAPSIDEAPSPPEKSEEILQRQVSHVDESPAVLDLPDAVEPDQSAPVPSVIIPNRLDKPLPPPQPSTPEIILIHFADEPAPQEIETDLPALPAPPPMEEVEPKLTDSPLEMETPNTTKSPPQSPTSIRHATPDLPSTIIEHDQTQSPPPHRPASRDAQRPTLSPQTTRTSPRDSKPPDPTPTTKVHEPQKKPTRIASPSPPPAPSKPVRHSQKGRPHSRSHSSQVPPPVNVPFPTQSTEAFPKAEGPSYPHLPSVDSPMTTSSMLANPPTPYNHRLSIAVSDVPPTLPPKSIYEEKREVLPPTHSSTRQTETFKLVRSSSENVYASGDTIVAAGQQWEVVESVEGRRRKDKSSSKSKDYDQSGSRDPKSESKASKVDEINDYRRQSHSHRSSKHPHHYDEEYSPTKVNVRSSRHQEEKSYYDDRDERKKYEEREERRGQDEREERRRQEDREQRRRKEERDERRRQEEREERRRQEEREERRRKTDREERRRQDEEREERKRQAEYEERKKQERRRQEEHKKQLEYEERKRKEKRKRQEERDELRRQEEYEERKKQEERSRREERKRREERSHREEKARREEKTRREEKSRRDELPRYDDRPRHEERSRRDEYRQNRPVEERDSISDYRSIHQPSIHQPSIHQPSVNGHSTQPQTAPSHPPSDPPVARLERNPSMSARPTSELPSAAEMNAMRAKEAWEMERLWKARSMYGLEPNAPINNFIPSPGSSSSKSDDTHTYGATHGSNHTTFMVQTPFQTHGSQIYHSMPTVPPPIIYSSPASIPSIPDSLSAYDPYEYPHSYRSHPTTTLVNPRGPSSLSRPPLNNPLPEPPRESSYEPASLSAKPNWTNYTGITTSH